MRTFAGIFFAALLAAPGNANDSIARLEAGGLILVEAETIVMEKEDLYISRNEVRVAYVFRNSDGQAKTHLVAFPMPEIAASSYLESDVSVPDRESDNYMRFTVTVDGRPIEPRLEMRASTGGIDVTDRLTALGIPLNPLAEKTREAAARLPREQLRDLIAMGAFRASEDRIDPSWSLRSAYYWLQTFPADAAIELGHTYAPAVGASFFTGDLLAEKSYLARYCIDAGTRKAIAKKLAARGEDFPTLMARDIGYVLSSGANWAGTIGDFRLVIDKGKPAAIVSFCMDGVKKIGPTQFEVRKRDFHPEKDLDILIVEDVEGQ
jgi:hypothetical protein